MDFDRKIINEFMLWKDSLKTKRKALIINGLRQIGKTYIVKNLLKKITTMLFRLTLKKNLV